MGRVTQDKPDVMPSASQVEQAKTRAKFAGFHVAGSRLQSGTKRRKLVHSDIDDYRRVGWKLNDVTAEKVVLFTHGYNVSRADGLRSFASFFKGLSAAMSEDGVDVSTVQFIGFTWPGDVGSLHFDGAQTMAHGSGVALYKLARDLLDGHRDRVITLVTHSLGAHVGLRAASIVGERRYSRSHAPRMEPFENVLLLAPAVENDVFRRPTSSERYHFPDSAFGMRNLHMFVSRADKVLKIAFATSEMDRALGFSGPETMRSLKSLSHRVRAIWPEKEKFSFQVHDFSPQSAAIMNPDLHAHAHSDYWERQAQLDYYANFV